MDDTYLERRLQQLEEDASEYLRDQRLILSELKRFNDWLSRLDARLNELHTRLTTQEIRAGLFGAIAGAIPLLIAALVWYFTHIGRR